MDWAKSKTILIAALLAANLFLVLMFVVLNTEDTANEAQIRKETVALLEKKNIFVKEEDIPLKHPDMPVLNVKNDRLEEEFLERKLEEQSPLPMKSRHKEGYLRMTEEFLRSCGIWTDHVAFGNYEEGDDTAVVSYRNEYYNHAIEDSYIICTIKDGVITEFDRYWLTPSSLGRTEKATRPTSAALITFMGEKERPEVITIEKIEMVYWIDSSTYNGDKTISDTAFPAWKIVYNHGLVRYVSAYVD